MGRLFYRAFIFLLRAQSAGLPIRRDSSSDRLLGQSPISSQCPIDIRGVAGEDRLVSELKTRKNARRGPILMRPCFCSGNIIDGKGLCPLYDFRSVVRRATPIGAFLFSGIRRKNLDRVSTASLTSLEIADANGYSPR